MTWSMSESSFFEHAPKKCLCIYIYKSFKYVLFFLFYNPHIFLGLMVDNQDSSVLRGLARFLGVPDDAEILQQAHFI